MKACNKKYLITLLIMAFALVGCNGDDGEPGEPGESFIIGVLPASSATSLDIEIDGVAINSAPVVTFTARDGSGVPIAGLQVGRGGNLRFTIAQLSPGSAGEPSNWQSYINSGSGQATYERDGVLEDLGNGQYSYTFETDITEVTVDSVKIYDPTLTHRVAMQIDGFPASNPSLDFRPDGGTVSLKRDIVKTETCNSCHNQLAMHGGGRIETKYCVTCHNPGTVDPDTGNTVDFKVMIHKIHYGEELPSVIGGTPYQIIGYNNSVHDYSTVVFPQDIRNCTKCHDGSDDTSPTYTEQGDNWKTQPSEEACGSCHDDIYFGDAPVGNQTVQHPGGATSNEFCVNCHVSGGNAEWQIEAAHTNPVKVAEPKFQFNILEICGEVIASADPDCPLNPATLEVTFSVSDPTGATTHGYGNLYDIAGATVGVDRDPEFGAGASLNILTGWDSSDYTNVDGDGSRPSRANSVSAISNAVDNGDGTFTIQLSALPATVTGGSGVIAMEGHPRAETVVGSGTFDISVPVRGQVAYFGINGEPLVERRVAVDIVAKCDNCHDKLSLHGNNRADNAQLCVICHNPRGTDIGRRDTDADGIPDALANGMLEESIDFKRLIHAIHAGDADEHGFRENGIVVYGYGNNAHDYSHVRFPGILNDCTTCHNTGTYELTGKWEAPLQNGILASTIESAPTATDAATYTTQRADQTDDLFTTPTAAVCSACHDGQTAQAHMEWMGGAKFSVDLSAINDSYETCSVCHGPGKIADLNLVHDIE